MSLVPRISKNGTSLVLSFRYHPKIINAVREIDGRTYDPKTKNWQVPVENVVDCVDILKPLGFTATTEVVAAYADRKAQLAAIEDWKANPLPYTGSLPLYDFQMTGAALIKGLPAFLIADVPGLGKTLQTIAGLEDCQDRLILCPASLKYNWRDEIKKWAPDTQVVVVNGTKAERAALWATKGIYPDVYFIANYELLRHDTDVMPKDWDAIVCDEADRIANPFSKTTRYLKALKSNKRIALTGTPISNTPDDLWSIVDWLYPRMLGSFTQFQKKYCKIHPDYKRVIGYQNLGELRDKVQPVMLRRMKEDVLKDFPSKTVEHIRFDISKEERGLYESVRKSIMDEIKKVSTMDTKTLNILPVKMLRLKQVTNHPILVDVEGMESTKLKTLQEMLKPIIQSGEKVIIFSQFAQMVHALKVSLQEYNPLMIKGDVPSAERKEIADRFQTNEENRILIMSEAGAYGLNLQKATYIFHYDAPWSIAKIEQREGRAHRIGQDKPVTVYHLIANKTIDEYVLKVLEGKKKMSSDILGDTDETLSIEDMELILGGEDEENDQSLST